MNSISITPEKKNRYVTWFWIIVVAFILMNIPAPRTTPITGYSGLNALHELITARWMKFALQVIYLCAFVWMIWQIASHLPAKHRLMRWTLWAVIVIAVCRWLCVWLMILSDQVQHTLLSVITPLYAGCMVWAGCLLVINYSGRLRHLGWAILAWLLVPMILPWLLYLVSANPDLLLNVCLIVEMVLAIYAFWRMKQVFDIRT